MIAEAVHDLAGTCIDGGQVAAVQVQQTTVGTIFVFPVIHAARAHPALVGVRPERVAGGGVESHDRVVLRENVHRVVDNDGVEVVTANLAGGVGPHNLELAYVGLIDLLEGG